MASRHILEAEELECRFGGLIAVANVSLRIPPNTLAGLIGPNGAGKTTLFNLLCHQIAPNAGRVRLMGMDVTELRSDELVRLGLARTFQQIRLFPQMTAVENVMAGGYVRTKSSLVAQVLGLPTARRQRELDEAHARALLERVGVRERQDLLASKLGFLEQHLVEIARVLATGPRMLLLDEPTTGMTEAEVTTLETLIRGLQADGITILIVEHNMRLVMRLCERIWVMNFGRLIAEGAPAEIASNPDVLEA